VPQLLVRRVDERALTALRARAARNGRSVEAEHRELLRQALLGPAPQRSFKEYLQAIPDVGPDDLFERRRERPRRVRL
jgi:plasmid stability protein